MPTTTKGRGAPVERDGPAEDVEQVEERVEDLGDQQSRDHAEDESADPVGDGHSDADLAARLPPRDANGVASAEKARHGSAAL